MVEDLTWIIVVESVLLCILAVAAYKDIRVEVERRKYGGTYVGRAEYTLGWLVATYGGSMGFILAVIGFSDIQTGKVVLAFH